MTITFLGTGAMGSAIAAATLERGQDVIVWNRTLHRTQPLRDRRATVAARLDQAIAGDGPIVACLLDHQSVHQTLAPVADQLAGRTLINLTTTTPTTPAPGSRACGSLGLPSLPCNGPVRSRESTPRCSHPYTTWSIVRSWPGSARTAPLASTKD